MLADANDLFLTGTAVRGTGNGRANTITGNSVNNVLDGMAGADTMVGGTGNDTYNVDNAGDRVTETSGQGTDMIISSVDTTLPTNVEALTLRSGSGAVTGIGNGTANTITGNALNNVLNGMAGSDTMIGGAGNDTYYVDVVADRMTEISGEGTDMVVSSVDWALTNDVEALLLGGSARRGTGNGLANTIIGNAAENILNGGVGNDTLTGGTGRDTFVLNTELNAATNVDRISDFDPNEDVIHLDNAVFTALTRTGTLSRNGFYIGTAAHDSDDRIIYNSQTGALIYDSNGSAAGGGVVFAMLAPGLRLDNGDFVVV